MRYGTNRIRRGAIAADRFTQISNALFRDIRISLKAKGLFGLLSTHRDGYGVTAAGLTRQTKEGISAIEAGLRELERYGYLERERERREDGTLGAVEYFITDAPAENPQNDENPRSEPDLGFPGLDHPGLENRGTKNTNIKNTSTKNTIGDEAPSARSAGDARRASAGSSARATSGGSAAAKKPRRSSKPKKPAQQPKRSRMSREEASAVRAVEAAWPVQLAAMLPGYRPPVIRDTILAALESRSAEQLAARIARRWWAHGYLADADAEGRGIDSPVGVAVALVRPGICPDPMCEDGEVIDRGAPCSGCQQRAADRRHARTGATVPAARTAEPDPVGDAERYEPWVCTECEAVRREPPQASGVCASCQRDIRERVCASLGINVP